MCYKDIKLDLIRDIDEATLQSRPFKITDAQFEEIWDRFIQMNLVDGKPPINFLGSINNYKKLLKKAAVQIP
jgi:hypothetical protein